MNDATLTISVVLCTYNGARYLSPQLDSILQQTYPLHEVLVFDDGSTDETLEMLQDYARRHPLIRVQQNPERLGFNGNFQQALCAASGEVIAISDQDDVWLPNKIEKCVAGWQPECPMVYCQSMRFEGAVPEVPERPRAHLFFEGTDARCLLFANTVSGHALMIRRSFLPKVLPFPEGVFYDWWSAFIAADNGGVRLVHEPLVLHRIHTHNASGHKEDSRKDAIMYHRKDVIRHLAVFRNAPHVDQKITALADLFYRYFTDRDTWWKKVRLFRLICKHLDVFFYYRKKKKRGNQIRKQKYALFWAFYD